MAAYVRDLCVNHQLEVLVVEDVATAGAPPQLLTQICTPHQPHILGTPAHVSEGSSDKCTVAGAPSSCCASALTTIFKCLLVFPRYLRQSFAAA
jgi:hypothetical protein